MARSIKVGFFGAAQERYRSGIGRSCHVVLITNDCEIIAIIIDSGADPQTSLLPNQSAIIYRRPHFHGLCEFIKDATKIIVVITHAHYDHSGTLPELWKYLNSKFPRVHIDLLMTSETWAFSHMWWEESILKMQRSLEWSGYTPLYTKRDLRDMSVCLQTGKMGREYRISDDITIKLPPAGHILGAVGVIINAFGENIVHTGDVSFDKQYLVPENKPFTLNKTKFLMTDSTYVGTEHEPREDVIKKFGEGIRRVFEDGGKVLLPVPQLHVAGERLMLCRELGFWDDQILLDGGARQATEAYRSFLPLRKLGWVNQIRNKEHMNAIVRSDEPVIVIASGGMLRGASLRWAKQLMENSKNGIFLSSWCDPCSPGDALTKTHREMIKNQQTDKRFVIDPDEDRERTLRCKVGSYHLSGHASGSQLEQLWRGLNPEVIALVHGDRHTIRKYKNTLGKFGTISRKNVFAPKVGDTVSL